MFKKLLAAVGIGAAKVETIFDTTSLTPGSNFTARILLKGGNVEQKINAITLNLVTDVLVTVEYENDDVSDLSDESSYYEEIILNSWHVCDSFTLAADEEKEILVEGNIPLETPITALPIVNNETEVAFVTELDIANAIDKQDRDPITTHPLPAQLAVLQAMDHIGFQLYKADVEKGYLNGNGRQSTINAYQEIEYKLSGFNNVEEVEVSFLPSEDDLQIIFEKDRRFGGESFHCLTLPAHLTNIDEIASQIKTTLSV